MPKKETRSSREIGLQIATICGKHFFKLEDLHYGYWTGDMEVSFVNLRKAQEDYTALVLAHIPASVRTILDVGCGVGQTARKLTDKGYKVDCVYPSPLLKEHARALLGDACRIFECPYEQLQTGNTYDMVMFCESFQYIPLDDALEKTRCLVKDNGFMLICDAFKASKGGSSGVGGGHEFCRFQEKMKLFPFELLEDIDITEQTAPNIDMMDDAMQKVAGPIFNSAMVFLSDRYPLMTKLLRWKYRKKIEKMQAKYFSGTRRSDDFRKFKTYRLLLYRKTA